MLFKNQIKKMVHVKKNEENFREQIKGEKLEKGDIPAMIFAATITFLPALIVVLGIFLGTLWFFFFR